MYPMIFNSPSLLSITMPLKVLYLVMVYFSAIGNEAHSHADTISLLLPIGESTLVVINLEHLLVLFRRGKSSYEHQYKNQGINQTNRHLQVRVTWQQLCKWINVRVFANQTVYWTKPNCS
ncbi:hypothetical protein QVD99_005492 [Batrachochytrium dendrobatidis]|nr:hypothetical protein QVD99_005492 [Batrachochytrium dendrobatidis]